ALQTVVEVHDPVDLGQLHTGPGARALDHRAVALADGGDELEHPPYVALEELLQPVLRAAYVSQAGPGAERLGGATGRHPHEVGVPAVGDDLGGQPAEPIVPAAYDRGGRAVREDAGVDLHPVPVRVRDPVRA